MPFPELLIFSQATRRGVGGVASKAWKDHDGKPEAFRTSEGKALNTAQTSAMRPENKRERVSHTLRRLA